MTTPAVTTQAALLARGTTVTLADGTQRNLRYDFLAMYHIEEEYGSLGKLMDAAKALQKGAMHSNFLGMVLDLVRFGWTDDNGDGLEVAVPRTFVARMLDLTRVSEYAEAALFAIDQAWGPTLPASASEGPADPTRPSSGSSIGHTPPSTVSSIASGT